MYLLLAWVLMCLIHLMCVSCLSIAWLIVLSSLCLLSLSCWLLVIHLMYLCVGY
jgi:hypothetical protein